MTVQELIDVLYKCSLTSEVRVLLDTDPLDCSTNLIGVVEVDDKCSDEAATVYLKHY